MNPIDRSNPDHAVEQLLHALGQTQPPPGLHHRLRANLEARAATPRSSWSPRVLFATLPRFATGSAFTLPLAALAMAAILLAVHFHATVHPASTSPDASTSPNASTSPAASTSLAASRYPEASASGLSGPTTKGALAPGAMPAPPQPTARPATPQLAANLVPRSPGLAWGFSPTNHPHPAQRALAPVNTAPQAPTAASNDPAYAPSFPAPPAPLTAQEKLLLRMVRHDTPVLHDTPILLAELDARDRHAVLSRERSDTEAFFSAFTEHHPATDAPPDPALVNAQPLAPPAGDPTPDSSSTDTTTTGDPQ